jgi:hypothetical protein
MFKFYQKTAKKHYKNIQTITVLRVIKHICSDKHLVYGYPHHFFSF